MPASSPTFTRMFVLRLWLEPDSTTGVGGWRATLSNPLNQEKQYFSDPARLGEFLANLDLRWPDETTNSPPETGM